jgi:succinoglycan biosynthesis protein ExoM
MKHICICVCTFKRPHLLRRLLSELVHQRTDALFTYSIVVIDNDCSRSAQSVVDFFQCTSSLDIQYGVESEQNIALARNKALAKAHGDFLAFIDDDEFPPDIWLLELLRGYNTFNVDGILGPVLPFYAEQPPDWIITGKFHERPSHETGTILDWRYTRTGNALIRRDIFDSKDNLFRPQFGSGGEDRDLFRRLISRGFRFAWCNEAAVFEEVPPERFSRSFMLRRALLRGKTPYNCNIKAYLKSMIAIPLYIMFLPVLFFMRRDISFRYLIKCFDHIGRLLAFAGIDVIKQKYIHE